MQTTLITADWLMRQSADDVLILDATYFLPTMGRDGRAEYEVAHIPGARFFGLDGIKDEASDLPHMIPSAGVFQTAMRALGLQNGQQIVVYDNSPFLSSARAWWMLRYFGHHCVAVLDGGLAAWLAAGGTVTDDALHDISDGNFVAAPPVEADVITFAELNAALFSGTADQIIDARAADRFAGSVPEPRPGLRAGHIPGSLNLPIGNILDKATGRLKPADQLSALFADAGVMMDKPVVTTCGSGVTAAGLTLALAVLGKTDIRLYDGSWSEWGASDAPVES